MGLDQLLAVAGQVAQLTDRRRRHEAAAQQPVLGQLRQPSGVGHVGFPAGQDLDVAGVDQQQLETPRLQHIPDRLPVLAGGLHHHLGDALGGQPVGQRLQLGAEGGKRADRLPALAACARIRGAHARHHLPLGHVQPGAALHQQVHHATSCGCGPTGPGLAGPTEEATL